jgi:hypothetical protein
MKYLKIQNRGILDIRLVALMGGTTKANDTFKIGQFGTGLKYTLAYLYRNNIDFKVFAGTEQIQLHLEEEVIQEEKFEIICINGRRTSITTGMGVDWEAWMIIRELWCNALDEGSALNEETEVVAGEEGTTTFFIQIDAAIRQVIRDWDKYFINPSTEPIFENDCYRLYSPGDHLCLYKQGVLIYENEKVASVFRYDIKNAKINELRQYQHSPAMDISRSLKSANEAAAKYFLEHVTESHYEGSDMDYNWFSQWSESWKNVIGSAKVIYRKVLDTIVSRGGKPDMAKLIVVPENLYRSLTDTFEGIGAVTVASTMGDFYETYNAEMEDRIKQGLVALEHCGYVMHPELTFTYGFFEDKTTLAQIDIPQKKIYIANAMLSKPLFNIIAMLIEENEHFNTGLSDETREFQQHFIDLYTRALLTSNKIEI